MTDSELKILKVELRDLQTLLRKKFSNELEVVKYQSESLLPPGENYGSTILKVDAVVKKNSRDEEEDLHLVAKMLPATEYQRKQFESPYTFRKEAFLYEELIPSYQRLEREFGVRETEIFDIVPELFGVRYSLKSDDDFDDDAVILMQNLKVLGYYTGNRKEVDSKMLAHFDRLNVAMNQDAVSNWTVPPPETWSTIMHSDFWVNNILFRKNPDTDRVMDIKFVNFQNYLNLSPLRELAFFVMISLNANAMDNHFDELLDLYYENFCNALTRLKCNTEPFSRDKFDKRLKIDAFHEFPHYPLVLRILSAEVEHEVSANQIENMMSSETITPLFTERLRRCVNKLVEKGWLYDSWK